MPTPAELTDRVRAIMALSFDMDESDVRDDVSHFLICERCGSVTEMKLTPDVLAAMERLAVEHGFAATGQCLDLHGVCRACEEAARRTAPAGKVMARYCFV